MKDTEYMLKGLSGGELQRLAFELLPRINHELEGLIHSGAVEGTHKTRKGTPDMWKESDEGYLVYVQVTTDSKYGKVYEDLSKSVERLLEEHRAEGALCIAFVSTEPQSSEVLRCQTLCQQNGCRFEIFHNSKIAKALDQVFNHDLRKYFLNITPEIKKSEKAVLITPVQKSEPSSDPRVFIGIGVILSVITMVIYLRNQPLIFWTGTSIFVVMVINSIYRIYTLKKKNVFHTLDSKYKRALWTPVFSWVGAVGAMSITKFPIYSSAQIELVKEEIIQNGMHGIVPRIIEMSFQNPMDLVFLLGQALSLWLLAFLSLLLLTFEVFHTTHLILNKRKHSKSVVLKLLGWINKRTSFSQSLIFLNCYLIVVSILFGSGLFAIFIQYFQSSTSSVLNQAMSLIK
ncbi:hypothetical protein OB236_23175 [Paenibacillus sp. WQ 127069]|uniref:Restriction endonuclease type IV Mrr domain-containing protein n=1 Tax=Paenibacillus baimaensis TaxID=2982185 RepID=A0ABT2UK75_9BACL|nr:hypothetical protein [Paenibacillus sp. WQ 127069]MCU6795013.1 hypothetical protein [Paenibacillus sp. WQ 127069]